jgi:hypothetical protein
MSEKFDAFMFAIVAFVGIVNIICVLLDDLVESHTIDISKIDSQIYLWVGLYLIIATNSSFLFKERSILLLMMILLLFIGSLVYSSTNNRVVYIGLMCGLAILFLREKCHYAEYVYPLIFSSILLTFRDK